MHPLFFLYHFSFKCYFISGELSNAQLVYFAVNTIRIGSWARFASMLNKDEWDLVCYSDPVQKQLIWQVQDDGHLFRIEVHFENIRQIRLGQVQTDMGQLEIQVEPNTTPISFSMRRADVDPDWVQCGDFTENRQASHQGIHALQGTHDSLRQSLLELIAQSPDLANKLILIPDKTPSLSRDDMASSPSATPEPFGQYYMNHWVDSAKPANPLFPPSYDWSYMLDQQTMHHFM